MTATAKTASSTSVRLGFATAASLRMILSGVAGPSCGAYAWGERSICVRALILAAAVIALLALSGCATKEELPPLPPAADMCSLYSSYRYNAAAAAVEATDALDKHNANERVFMTRCLIGDRSKSLGPR